MEKQKLTLVCHFDLTVDDAFYLRLFLSQFLRKCKMDDVTQSVQNTLNLLNAELNKQDIFTNKPF